MGKSLDRCSTFQLKTCSRGRRLPKDRFSSLPDDILLFIMSFLTFKEVVKTSILSRRWLNLWMHTLVIHFHTVVPKDSLINDRKRQKYVKWVNRALRRHKGQYLTEFKIVCELDKRHQEDIDNWLLAALAKKVQCLELNFLLDGLKPSNLHNTYVFPGPFLNLGCGKANSNGGKSQFLQSDFKCLNSLSLKRVDVTDEAINFVLLNCPFLERLEVVGSVKLANLIISDPTLVLKYLKITHCFKLEVLTISNFNLVSLDISAVRGLTLTNLPMLVELFISGSCVELSHSISQASSCFSQLEAFKLSGFELKVKILPHKVANPHMLLGFEPLVKGPQLYHLDSPYWLDSGTCQDITQLCNYSQLTKLKRLVIDVKAKGDDLTKLISIANYCPRLEEFVLMLHWFQVPRGFGGRFGRTISEVERHNSSLKSRSLKVFEFVGYSGDAADVKLIMHVVENAVSLEKIIIDPCDVIHIGRFTSRTRLEEEVRRIVLQQFDSLRESIPPHINLILR